MANGSFFGAMASLVTSFRKAEAPPIDPAEREDYVRVIEQAEAFAGWVKHPTTVLFMAEVDKYEEELVESLAEDAKQKDYLIQKAQLKAVRRLKNIVTDTIAAGKEAAKMLSASQEKTEE